MRIDDCGRYHEGVELGGRDGRALHGGEHRDGRRDHAVAVEQRRAEEADEHERPSGCPALAAPSGVTSAVRARMPPSPWLSARMTNVRYLTQITSTSDQNMSDSRPSTLASMTASWWLPLERLPHGEQRVGADVAEDHAQGADGQPQGAGVGGVPPAHGRVAGMRFAGALVLLR